MAPAPPLPRKPASLTHHVAESDGTLILNVGRVSGGTRVTVDFAKKQHKPCLVVQLDKHPEVVEVAVWLDEHGIRTLNVAGPRESKHSGGVYLLALAFLRLLLADLQRG